MTADPPAADPPAPVAPDWFPAEALRLGIRLPQGALALLARYAALVLAENERMNVVRVASADEFWRRHVLDCLTLVPLLDQEQRPRRVLDIGTGGGLPGIAVAIARPDLQVALVDATAKKARFVEHCAAELGLANVEVICARAEDLAREPRHRERCDAVIARAVAELCTLLEFALPLVVIGGVLLALKGKKAGAEVAAAERALEVLGGGDVDIVPTGAGETPEAAVIVRVRKERRTPQSYPRGSGKPVNQPL